MYIIWVQMLEIIIEIGKKDHADSAWANLFKGTIVPSGQFYGKALHPNRGEF